jgi:hypothetical protein
MVDSGGNKERNPAPEDNFSHAGEGGKKKEEGSEKTGKDEGTVLSHVSGNSPEKSNGGESNLLKIWKNRGKILEGIKNNIFKKEHVVQIAEERRIICEACEYHDVEGSKCASNLAPKPCCGHCGCSIKLKTFSMSSECPVGKWKSVMNEEEEKEFEQKTGITI